MSLHPRVAGNITFPFYPSTPTRSLIDWQEFSKAFHAWAMAEGASQACFWLAVGLYRSGKHYRPTPPLKRGCAPWPPRSRYLAYLREECHRLGASYIHAKGHSKTRPEALARMFAWKRLRDQGFSLPGIAATCFKDHTSILSGLRRLELLDSITQFSRSLATENDL